MPVLLRFAFFLLIVSASLSNAQEAKKTARSLAPTLSPHGAGLFKVTAR